MDMVKVDPKLFVTCRLCLEEMGMYQITPVVQHQIKYCFDIDVDQFDGLPQLICAQCETVLSEYFTKKRIFVGRQNALKAKLQVRKEVEGSLCSSPPHEAVTSSQQNDNEEVTKRRKSTSKPRKRKSRVISSSSSSSAPGSPAASTSRATSLSRSVSPNRAESNSRAVSTSRADFNSRIGSISPTEYNVNKKLQEKKRTKLRRDSWEANYTKKYVCKLCNKYLKFGAGIGNHVRTHASLLTKYENIINNSCKVELPKIDNKLNPTGNRNTVALSQDKILGQRKENVYVIYTSKEADTNKSTELVKSDEVTYIESDDEDETIGKSRHIKRRRLLSRSSTDTLNLNKSPTSDVEREAQRAVLASTNQGETEIECINIDDSSNGSNQSDDTSVKANSGPVDPKDVESIKGLIKICQNKYISKRQEMLETDIKKNVNKGSQLKKKLLSMGRKVINKQSFNCTGLLRFMENNNLTVKWIPTISGNKETHFVRIMPRVKTKNELVPNNIGWKKKQEMQENSEIEILPKQYIHTDPGAVFMFIPQKTNTIEIQRKQNPSEIIANNATKPHSQSKSSETVVIRSITPTNNSNAVSVPTADVTKNVTVLRDVSTPKMTSNEIHLSMPDISSNHDFNEVKTSNVSSIDKNITPVSECNTSTETTLFQDFDTKLLNANPVANPKQLPKKSIISDSKSSPHALNEKVVTNTKVSGSLYIDLDNNQQINTEMCMPIITSTTSLAGPSTLEKNINASDKESNNADKKIISNETTNEVEKSAPRIKVKPFSELMSDRVLKNLAQEQSVPNNILTPNLSTGTVPQNNLGLIITQVSSGGVPVSAAQVIPPVNPSTTTQNSRSYVILDTVELPNTKTDSPFQYFRNLLLIHNIVLLESHATLPSNAHCLIRFKLQFCQNHLNKPVTLCLSVHCSGNTFFFGVRDPSQQDYIELHKLNVNLQLEILNIYTVKQDVVSKMLQNAQKINQQVHEYTKRVLCLLGSINKKDEVGN